MRRGRCLVAASWLALAACSDGDSSVPAPGDAGPIDTDGGPDAGPDAPPLAKPPPLTVASDCDYAAADCNPCVDDVPAALARIRDHGDVLGFHMEGFAEVGGDLHWQGVQRLTAGDARRLAVSRSGFGKMFVLVTMESRDEGGKRFRSNRLDPGLPLESTPPPAVNRIVTEIAQDEGFDHAGGLQALGQLLAVPLENGTASRVVFYDVSGPDAPTRLGVLERPDIGQAGTASLGKLADGRFVLIAGRRDAQRLDFYVSATTSFSPPDFELFRTWTVADDGVKTTLPDGDAGFGHYQSLDFVNQCDGALYLVGTYQTDAGDNFVNLFRVENGANDTIAVTKVGKKHLYCAAGGTSQCDLATAGGAYVGPDRQLYLYATERGHEGPDGTVMLEEFRPMPLEDACPTIEQAWVELYEDTDFGGRSLMIDWLDRDLEDYANYAAAEGFEDTASSARWCLPTGHAVRLWQDKAPCGGNFFDLAGSSKPDEVADLGAVGFGDATSCSEWTPP